MFAPLINAAKANRVSRRTLADGSESLQPRPDQAGFGSVERILALQRTIGNQGVLRLLGRTPHDLTSQGAGHVVDAALQSSGQPLPPDTQRYFSAAFGHDFAGVRIHADAPAAASASALHANAYTVGKHIAFAPGRYQPGHHIGMRLLAHELAHVMQQRGGGAAPGPAQEQDAEAASRAVEVGATPNVAAASQVGIAAQPEESTVANVKNTPFEQLMWFYRFYTDRLGYRYQGAGGNKGRLINPKGGHFVDVTFDAQNPQMVSVIVAGKSFEASEFNFSSERFETRARHIEQVVSYRRLSVPERIGIGFSATSKIVGGAALCVWGTAETVGLGAVAACAYGADVTTSGIRELRGEQSRTLINQAVSSRLSHLVGDEMAQRLTDDAEATVNIMLGGYQAAKPPKAPVVLAEHPPAVPHAVPEGAPPPVIEPPTPQPPSPLPKASTEPMRVAPGAAPLGVFRATPNSVRAHKPSRPPVELRTDWTPDLGTPEGSGTSQGAFTPPMKKLPGGAHRGSVTQGVGDPVAHPRSQPTVEARTQRTLDYGEALEASVGPHSKAPDPWAAPPQPAKVSAPRARPGHHADAGQAAQEAQAQGLADPQRGRIGMQEHRSAPAVREATGQTGQNVDSTHLVPQVVYNWIRKSPALARTANLPAAINIAIDSVWVPKWARATGRGKQVTGGDVREWVSEGIRNVPDSLLSPAAKGTLQWSLELELQGLGITPDTVIVPRWR